MNKKLVSIGLVVVMCLSMVVGCGKSTSKKVGDGSTLTVGIPQDFNISSYEDNALTDYFEETLNIKLKFEYYSSTATNYIKQLSMSAASGQELPDVLVGFRDMSIVQMNEYGEDGIFEDLTELIEKYGDNYKAQLKKLSKEEQERIKRKGTADDGGFYSMPLYSSIYGVDNMQNLMYINQTWLDKLNLKAPTNIEELYTVLKAFKTQDPNGNKIADEIPLIGPGNGDQDVSGYILNAFLYYDVSNKWNVKNGKVSTPYTTDEYREALIFMNKLYNEDLLSKLTYTTSVADLKNLITPADGISKVGIFGGHPLNVTDSTSSVLDEYVALGFLADATGKGGYNVVRENTLMFGNFITSDCENTEIAMRFLDLFYADETVSRIRHGEKGVDWEEKAGKDSYGEDAIVNVINDQAFFKGNSTWGGNFAGILTNYNYNAVSTVGQENETYTSKLITGTWKVMEQSKVPSEKAEDLHYTTEEYKAKSDIQASINSYVGEQMNLFIVGDNDINNDSVWKTYLKTLDDMQLDTLLDYAQKAYDRK